MTQLRNIYITDPNDSTNRAVLDAQGHLIVRDAGDGLGIAQGSISNTTYVHKFGEAPDFDVGDGNVTIWDGAEDGTGWEQMQYVYSTTADIDSISSTNTLDTQVISITGLDSNWEEVVQTATLNGQTRVALTNTLVRCYRALNTSASDFNGHVIIYAQNDTLSGGVPNDSTNIRTVIQPDEQQTLMAVYTVPSGKTGYLRSWYASTSGGTRTAEYIMRLSVRPKGETFKTKQKNSISDAASSYFQHDFVDPEKFVANTDIEVRCNIATGAVTGASISAGFDIVLVDD